MKTTAKLMALTVTVAAILSAFCACTPGKKPNSETTKQGKDQVVSAFVPALDTTGEVTIDVASFFGNFEALDQVINHFNTFYPNVTVSYESYNNTNSDSFLKANPSIDIFMTSNANGYPTESASICWKPAWMSARLPKRLLREISGREHSIRSR